MSADLTEFENTLLGASAAVIEGTLLQPTVYAKNAQQQRLPQTLDPRLLWRGLGPALAIEMGHLSLSFGATSAIRRYVLPESLGDVVGDLASAAGAGGLVGALVSPCELVMIQQQRFGLSFFDTVAQIVRTGGVQALTRGLACNCARDGIFVGGMLGATPIAHRWLLHDRKRSSSGSGGLLTSPVAASIVASILGGVAGSVVSHPFDVVKTCMQGGVDQKKYGSALSTVRSLLSDGGWPRLTSGLGWRTLAITVCVFVAHECTLRLPAHIKTVTRSTRGSCSTDPTTAPARKSDPRRQNK